MTPERDSLLDTDLELPRIHGNPKVDEASKRLAARFDLARQIIRARVAHGWTQADLAREAQTKQSRVSEIESAKGNPTLETIERILNALSLRVSFGPAGSRMFFSTMSYRPVASEAASVSGRRLRAGGKRGGRILQASPKPRPEIKRVAAFEHAPVHSATSSSSSRIQSA